MNRLLDKAINWNCFSLTIGDFYRINFCCITLIVFLTACVMCFGNRKKFYSTARLNSFLGYLLDNECYASLSVKVFSTRRNFFRAERHFLLFDDQLAVSGREKTKENIIPQGKFRPVDNGL